MPDPVVGRSKYSVSDSPPIYFQPVVEVVILGLKVYPYQHLISKRPLNFIKRLFFQFLNSQKFYIIKNLFFLRIKKKQIFFV
jgi:hypothetical protein